MLTTLVDTHAPPSNFATAQARIAASAAGAAGAAGAAYSFHAADSASPTKEEVESSAAVRRVALQGRVYYWSTHSLCTLCTLSIHSLYTHYATLQALLHVCHANSRQQLIRPRIDTDAGMAHCV
jgi:hypothetical protein